MKRYTQNKNYKGLSKLLLVTKPYRDANNDDLVLVNLADQSIKRIPSENLSSTNWGFVYERQIGLYYEDQGYTVDYRGFRLGFLDSGIDLVADKKGAPTHYIQCKATKKKLGKQTIETILYNGGNFIAKDMEKTGRTKPEFVLAVLDKNKNMSSSNQYRFLRHNKYQNRTTLSILSYPWVLYQPQTDT